MAYDRSVSPFDRLGRFVAHRARLVVGVWGLLILVALPLAPQVPGALSAGGFIRDDLESARAKAILEDRARRPAVGARRRLLAARRWRPGRPAFELAAAAATRDVPDAPARGRRRLASALAAPGLGRPAHRVRHRVPGPPAGRLAARPADPRERLHEAPGIEVELAGGPAFYGDVQAVSERDLQRSELISLPLAALALLLVFGSLVAAGVPLAVGGASVLVALAAIFLVASLTPMSIFVLNLATLLGLGLGVDYSLLMTSRFREELARRDPDDPERVADGGRLTVATAGRAVFFSGLTVLLGLLGLVLFEFMILRSVGIAGAIVVFFAVAAAMTLLPALLALFGGHLDRSAIRQVDGRRRADGPWARLARSVMRRPVAVLIPTLALLLVLGSPFLHVRFNAPDSSVLPADVPSRAAFDRLRDEFGEGEFAPLALAVRTTGPATDPANLAALFEYSRRLAADPRVARVDSLVDVDPRLTLEQYQLLYGVPGGPRDRFVAEALAATTRGDLTAFTITTPYGPNREEGRALVARPARPGGRPGAAGGRDGPRRRRRGRRQGRRRWRGGRLPADRRCSSSSPRTSCSSCSCARSSCRSRRWS